MSIRDYTADTIEVARDIAQIRRRPTGFIGTKDTAGQVHMIREIIDNSVDELILRPEGGTIYICLLRDRITNRYQIIVKDNGRGIPSAALLDVTTVLGASGKSNALSAYNSSGGLYGIGAKVAAALSTKFRVISSNYLEPHAGSVYLTDGEVKTHTNEVTQIPNGVLTVFEPDLDPKFFIDGTTFMDSGYLDLVAICKQLNIFNENINFQFYIYERKIPEKFWTASTEEAYTIATDLIERKQKLIEYASDTVPDKSMYLFEMWRTNSNIIFSDSFNKVPVDVNDRLGFNIKMFFSKKSATGNAQYFITVNNVALPDKTENSATVSFMHVLRNRLASYQETDVMKNFVLQEYRFPTLMLAIGIKYNNAELSGVTKTSFKDSTFAKQFIDELSAMVGLMDEDYWLKLATLLKQDIELRYSQFYDAPSKKSEDKRIFADLNFSDNYKECRRYDDAELYIVEGTSAGNITETREPDFQAIYETRGKPTNAATNYDQMDMNRKRLLKDPIYQDIMKIMNIGPNTTDMSTARFKRLIIATDADPDGYHIRSLHLNNLYIINPRIIESGMVWLANPPLYSMEVSKNKRLFLRDKVALMDARVQFIYRPSLEVRIDSKAGIINLTEEAYRDMCYLVNHIGDQFNLVAQQLNIPLLILERLVYAIEFLYPKVDYLNLARVFQSADPEGYVRVQVNEVGKFMVISVGKEDHVVGLDSVGEAVVNHLLPLVNKFKYRDMMFLVRSNHKSSFLKNEQPMSMMMLYICMQQLDGLFDVRRYKGLGEMNPPDCYDTIMNPETRSLTHVTNIGDPQENFALLGKDTSERKQLLTSSSSVLSNLFVRDNKLR